MALKLNVPFPILAPSVLLDPNPEPKPPNHHRGPDVVRFSRWNNANAERFNQQRRAQEEIEADLRRHRRFDAAARIVQTQVSEPEAMPFKSRGTPSLPSAPSIPGKKSKYSKPYRGSESKPKNKPQVPTASPQVDSKPAVKLSDDGLSYVIDGAPFEFKYSYTETPKVKPLKLREAPYAPFGPTTMGRPWTGRPPLPPSKKKLKEFDSFQLPPPGKKGLKPVQKPGPFVPGSGPRYVYTREEILGEPLTREEIKELVKGCINTRRQLNMGRDGLTHNMLDNIHDLWKRRRVCKIKCKGVCTVDMDNVCQQLEEKTGGKIIYRKGGVIFLFRGRNYNYRTRPRFPLMLWKPVSPVYPRLIQRVPEGLTLEEATEMRRKGRELIPICKLAKNGMYCNLVKNVREAFEVCELVRINCQGIKGSDYRKIGAKLKDLVPCVLISFENEHILIWRGRDWKSSLSTPGNMDDHLGETEVDYAVTVSPSGEDKEASLEIVDGTHQSSVRLTELQIDQDGNDQAFIDENSLMNVRTSMKTENVTLEDTSNSSNVSQAIDKVDGESFLDRAEFLDGSKSTQESSIEDITELTAYSSQTESVAINLGGNQQPEDQSETSEKLSKPVDHQCTERVRNLMKQAMDIGMAQVLDDSDLDADVILAKVIAFAKTAPPGPVFEPRSQKPKSEMEKKENKELGKRDSEEILEKRKGPAEKVGEQKQSLTKGMEDDLDGDYRDVVPHGTLRVDELAKLLA